jgi:hypothetical protein
VFGQWIGRIEGTNSGNVVLDVDEDRPDACFIHIDDLALPLSAVGRLEENGSGIRGRLTGFVPKRDPSASQTVPRYGEFSLSRDGDSISGTWSTNTETRGTLSAIRVDDPIARPADYKFSWSQFRDWALGTGQESGNGFSEGIHATTTPWSQPSTELAVEIYRGICWRIFLDSTDMWRRYWVSESMLGIRTNTVSFST